MPFRSPGPPRPRVLPVAVALLTALAASGPSTRAQATSTSLEKFQSSPAVQFDAFGRRVAVHGDSALVASFSADNIGAAFSYRRVGGAWSPSQKFRGADSVVGDAFGVEMRMAGTEAVIGADMADVAGRVNAGAAYVFHDDGSSWTQVAKLVAPDGAANDFFGFSVAIAGDLIAVGAIDDDDGGNITGSVYVYRRSGATWVFEQKLHASSPDPEDEFGFTVETDGQTIVASSVVDVSGGIAAGAVYVFRHDGASWTEQQRIVPADASADDWFGWSLDLDGNRLAIGAPKQDLAKPDGGAVYTYRFDGASWALEDEFAPSKLSANDAFGWSLALQGDRLVAGAPSTTLAGGSPDLFDGALYQFHFDGTRWVEVHQWLTSDTAVAAWPGPNFGYSCALDGTTVFSGAPFHDGGAINSGAAYRFELTDLGLQAVPATVPAGGSLSLRTDGGLAGGKTALLLTAFGGMPLAYVLWLDTFDGQGQAQLDVTAPAAVAGFTADFVAAGFWHTGPYALSNPVSVSFQ